MFRNPTQTFIYIFLILLLVQSEGNAKEAELLYSGQPPLGEIYYTSIFACGDVDDSPGEEIVITDDYGSFEILDWKPVTKSFQQKWLSDPVFNTSKIRRIYIPLARAGYDNFLIFADSSNNLRIFKWLDYMTEEEPTVQLNQLPDFTEFSDFAIGEFSRGYRGWEIASIATKSIDFSFFTTRLGYFRVGNLRPDFKRILSRAIINPIDDPKLIIDHGFDGAQGIVIAPKPKPGIRKFKIIYSIPPFMNYREYTLIRGKNERLGWIGKIEKNGVSYVTLYRRSEKTRSEIRFYRMNEKLEFDFSVSVPGNVSSWELGDLDADGIRELVILDFTGTLHIYRLNSILRTTGNRY